MNRELMELAFGFVFLALPATTLAGVLLLAVRAIVGSSPPPRKPLQTQRAVPQPGS
jgi:hypothetical protein